MNSTRLQRSKSLIDRWLRSSAIGRSAGGARDPKGRPEGGGALEGVLRVSLGWTISSSATPSIASKELRNP